MKTKDELINDVASDIHGIYTSAYNMNITLEDTLGSEKVGDYLAAMTKMAETVTTYFQILIDKEEEEK